MNPIKIQEKKQKSSKEIYRMGEKLPIVIIWGMNVSEGNLIGIISYNLDEKMTFLEVDFSYRKRIFELKIS